MMTLARRIAVLLPLALAPGLGGAQSPDAGQPGELAVGARLADDYVALRQRPLFSPDRSPPLTEAPAQAIVEAEPEAPAEPLPAAAPPAWELVGLVRSERLNSAMFRAVGNPTAFSLRQGESRDGWTLSQIGRFEVFVENGEGQARIGFPTP